MPRGGVALFHAGIRGGEVSGDYHGDRVLQLLPALIPEAGAHGLEVENFSINVSESSSTAAASTTPYAP